MKKFFTGLVVFLSITVFINVLFLDWWILREKKEEKIENVISFPTPVFLESPTSTPSCQLACQELIEEKIEQELARFPSPAGQSSVSPPVSNKAKIDYIPLVTDGNAKANEWSEVVPSEFYFNLSDYPGAKEVRFEAYLLSSNQDQAYARLYDVTNKRGVDNSDLSFKQGQYSLIQSSPISIWRGNNKYVVQLRSVNATQVFIKEAKLKIFY